MRRQQLIYLFLALSLQFSHLVTPISDAEESRVIDRRAYQEKLTGFWLGQSIANWTGLRTEGARKEPPFLTDSDWGKANGRNYGGEGAKQMIEFVLVPRGEVWGADDDTDIEYIYQELLLKNQTALLSPEQIKEGWLTHIKLEEENYLWVSNETALHLMAEGVLPPETSLPENNKNYLKIDAQLTTEIFGLLSPTRPDFALKMANLPIRTTAYKDSQWISEFYVMMHALASDVDPSLSANDMMFWLADQAKVRLPEDSTPRKIYDFVLKHYESNADKDDWESTRDALAERYQINRADGYDYGNWFDANINFGASLVSLFYGRGEFKRTLRIGTLAGWDSDNPTATWGGLIGFMLGAKGIQAEFPDTEISHLYNISRTRVGFPDRTKDLPGDDRFELMARRGITVIDRVMVHHLGGRIDEQNNRWVLPLVE